MRLVFYCDSSAEIAGAERSLAILIGALSPRFDVTVMGVDRRVIEWVAAHRPGVRTRLVRPSGDTETYAVYGLICERCTRSARTCSRRTSRVPGTASTRWARRC